MPRTPKTITDAKIEYASGLVKQAFEPKVAKMVEELNKVLAPRGIRAGCDITWLFDELDESEPKDT